MKVGILGGGRWGEALARLVLAAGHEPFLAYRRGDRKPPHVLPSTDDPPKVADACELLIVATSAAEVRNAIRLARPSPAHRIVVAGRGIDPITGDWLTDAVSQECGTTRVGALAGPAPVDEILNGALCAGAIASRDEDVRLRTVEALHSSRYRCYETPDLVGTQLAGAAMPVLATMLGLALHLRGAGVGMHGMVLARGLAETVRLGDAIGADRRTFLGIGGIGDLVAALARNGQPHYDTGRALAAGRTPTTDAPERLARALRALARLHRVETPLLDALVEVLDGGAPIDAVGKLMRRDSRAEWA